MNTLVESADVPVVKVEEQVGSKVEQPAGG